ncbi:toll/interleukin-1 receptor domain-containing protein [Halocynthiibacter styelae]|uniref:Toll/interleukin-1 receptor domain-containing protein n=1 Tax=Halocynthiibacter styelae TaxID=2761955 RepID=A0A8J7IMW1_9RHOB|nr:toll/interleukin-1 receptor domain-containing protein [Paenihalocynthiibacter styelae]MBI1493636.1 toll/interleukin-1 receptor domain-containing protein [Paenihalocynthiibacter styelae]
MKILISHSSQNADYGGALVKLLTGIGIDHDSIIFTSDTSYGIPVGENIFDWLKERITEKPFVIYLLSPQYYSSVACLNEMGAAWIVENQHAMIFTPGFDLKSDYFLNGAIDPREIGFFLNDEDRVTQFIESLRGPFKVTDNQVLIGNKRREFMQDIARLFSVSSVNNPRKKTTETITAGTSHKEDAIPPTVSPASTEPDNQARKVKKTPVERYFQDLADDKLKDGEVMVIYYAAETAQYKLGVGWRTNEEVGRIRKWEELNDLGDTLSKDYETVISRLEIRNLTEVSETTSYGNPRQVMLSKEMQDELMDLPDDFYSRCDKIAKLAAEKKNSLDSDEIPF